MRIRVLGGHGGLAKGFVTTSFLINDDLLVDAGGVVSNLSIDDQAKIDHILITHTHLDHIKDLAFISDNCFGMRKEPFRVHTHPTVKGMLKKHLLNDIIWPDFTVLPSVQNPTMLINEILPEISFKAGPYSVVPVPVLHAHDAMGFIIEKDNTAVLFTGDTGPTDRIWEVAKKVKNLKAIFTEVSFPDRFQNIADLSDHHTSKSIGEEIKKMPPNIPIVLTHFKPNFRDEILKEIASLNESRIKVLERDGQVFKF